MGCFSITLKPLQSPETLPQEAIATAISAQQKQKIKQELQSNK